MIETVKIQDNCVQTMYVKAAYRYVFERSSTNDIYKQETLKILKQ